MAGLPVQGQTSDSFSARLSRANCPALGSKRAANWPPAENSLAHPSPDTKKGTGKAFPVPEKRRGCPRGSGIPLPLRLYCPPPAGNPDRQRTIVRADARSLSSESPGLRGILKGSAFRGEDLFLKGLIHLIAKRTELSSEAHDFIGLVGHGLHIRSAAAFKGTELGFPDEEFITNLIDFAAVFRHNFIISGLPLIGKGSSEGRTHAVTWTIAAGAVPHPTRASHAMVKAMKAALKSGAGNIALIRFWGVLIFCKNGTGAGRQNHGQNKGKSDLGGFHIFFL